MKGHTIAIRLVDDWLTLDVTCHEPPGAICHLVCEQGCEEASESHEQDVPGHKLVPYVIGGTLRCSIKEWLDNEGAQEMHVGDELLYEGLFLHEWDGDSLTWRIRPAPLTTGQSTSQQP